jgi:hypothetical protein
MDNGLLVNKASTWKLGKPQVVVYMAMVNGRAECVRVEIGTPFAPGQDPMEIGSKFPERMLHPINGETIKELHIPALIRDTQRYWPEFLRQLVSGEMQGGRKFKVSASSRRWAKDYLATAEETARFTRPGPQQLEKEHFANVAKVYEQAIDAGMPPRLAVAEQFQVSQSTAGRWVGIARNEFRLLPKTTAGVARSKRTPPRSQKRRSR